MEEVILNTPEKEKKINLCEVIFVNRALSGESVGKSGREVSLFLEKSLLVKKVKERNNFKEPYIYCTALKEEKEEGREVNLFEKQIL